MWVAYFLNYADRQAVTAMFPALRRDPGMTDEQLGLVVAVFLWVYAFCCPIAGQLGDRCSKRTLVVLSLIIWSIVTAATGSATSAMMMLALRAAMGVSESLFMPTAIALTANAHAPEQRSRAIATLMTAQVAGTVAGAWFGGWMADLGNWRGAFYTLGAVGMLYALPYFMFLRSVEEPPRASSTPAANAANGNHSFELAALGKIPTFLLLCVVYPVLVFGLWLLYGWLPLFLHDKFSLSQSDAAFNATAFLQGATAVGLLCGGLFGDAMYRRSRAARFWIIAVSFLLCAPCLHVMGGSATLGNTRIAATAFGLWSGLLMGNIFPAAFEVVPVGARASAIGMLNFFGAITSGFAAWLGGRWKESLGIDRLLTITSLAYVAACLLLLIGTRLFFRRDCEQAR